MENYIVTADWLRLREGPGMTYKTLGYLARNSIVQSDEESDTWLHVVNSDGQTGWSSSKHLQRVDTSHPQPPAEGIGSFSVRGGALNMRHGPGKNYGIVGALFQDQIVEGVAQTLDGQWTQVRTTEGQLGWSSTKYLARSVAATPPPGTELEMVVTAEVLNVRSRPGANFAVIGALHRGDVVTVINVSPDWAWMQVSGPGGGWCAAKYLLERDMLEVSGADFPLTGMHRVATYVLGMREKPGTDERILGTLQFNQVVMVDLISEDKLWKHCTDSLGQTGWCAVQFLASLGDFSRELPGEEFPWLPVAFGQLGIREIPGNKSNPQILEYLASTNLFKFPYLPDETNWCAAFVNWCLERAGAESANSALVFPWTRWGRALDKPRRGCLAAFQWEDGGQHLSLYLGELSNYVIALGGNQSDAVWINVYHKRHVISYRVPGYSPERVPAAA